MSFKQATIHIFFILLGERGRYAGTAVTDDFGSLQPINFGALAASVANGAD